MTSLLLFAQEGAAPQSPGLMPLFVLGMVVLFLMVVVFPAQRRQKKEQDKLVATLKRGTKVLTNAGIVATVVSATDGEDEIVIRSEDTKLRIKRNVVVQVLGSDEAAKS
ncbi:preprotein translocase subunit YajC [Gemmata obscuriglobus]|uniref:Sec translocon accessory complex subunit YajC n=1 Tax=Gemmata obscuriglobus TaxID=114 RepID=A0A2Z3H9G7_9BACT|nr:preprotein translocase subunit YajC [Gemmata obscuriglobus]AWM41072.1 preprotein translocase subunit YajC [Gemmata obscuriglobus]QEG25601.1 preprotein translocase subunit YajC [Gemmata obscuriglobus]VTR99073.1 YajC OS=Haemophilus influenzae KR494 GN=yajC PE=4 SV=1: YajC [Gemmata obscuriglobus UQM 2246]